MKNIFKLLLEIGGKLNLVRLLRIAWTSNPASDVNYFWLVKTRVKN